MDYDYSKILSFDLETTGVDVNSDRIVTSSNLIMDNTTGAVREVNFLADPGMEIPEGAAEVHGISTEKAQAEGLPHDLVVRLTKEQLYWAWDHNYPVVVYNAAYDLSMMTALDPTFEVHGLVLDPLVLDKAVDKYRKGSRKLVDTYRHYMGKDFDDAHNSAADSRAAGEVTWMLMNRVLPGNDQQVPGTNFTFSQAQSSVEKMMNLQRVCAEEQRSSLAQYLLKSGKIQDLHEIDTGWPIQNSTLQKIAR